MSRKVYKRYFVSIYKEFNVILGGFYKSQTSREISGNFFSVALWVVLIVLESNFRGYDFFPTTQAFWKVWCGLLALSLNQGSIWLSMPDLGMNF